MCAHAKKYESAIFQYSVILMYVCLVVNGYECDMYAYIMICNEYVCIYACLATAYETVICTIECIAKHTA